LSGRPDRIVEGSYYNGRMGSAEEDCDADRVKLGDLQGEYIAAGRATPKGKVRLHVIRAHGKPVVSCQYVHLDSMTKFEPTKFVLRFAGSMQWQITVNGRNLWKVYDGITRHSRPWIKTAERDIAGYMEPVITGIEVEEVKEE
jgi:hypothetical protein